MSLNGLIALIRLVDDEQRMVSLPMLLEQSDTMV
jgi:hypothetical protein